MGTKAFKMQVGFLVTSFVPQDDYYVCVCVCVLLRCTETKSGLGCPVMSCYLVILYPYVRVVVVVFL